MLVLRHAGRTDSDRNVRRRENRLRRQAVRRSIQRFPAYGFQNTGYPGQLVGILDGTEDEYLVFRKIDGCQPLRFRRLLRIRRSEKPLRISRRVQRRRLRRNGFRSRQQLVRRRRRVRVYQRPDRRQARQCQILFHKYRRLRIRQCGERFVRLPLPDRTEQGRCEKLVLCRAWDPECPAGRSGIREGGEYR